MSTKLYNFFYPLCSMGFIATNLRHCPPPYWGGKQSYAPPPRLRPERDRVGREEWREKREWKKEPVLCQCWRYIVRVKPPYTAEAILYTLHHYTLCCCCVLQHCVVVVLARGTPVNSTAACIQQMKAIWSYQHDLLAPNHSEYSF